MTDIITMVATNPLCGDAIVGSGGCRKVRVAASGRGKRGGYHLITFYGGVDIPVYLLTIYAKNDKGNLSKTEVNALAVLTKQLVAVHRR